MRERLITKGRNETGRDGGKTEEDGKWLCDGGKTWERIVANRRERGRGKGRGRRKMDELHQRIQTED